MRYTPQQIDAMSLWEFAACVDGFVRSKGIKDETAAPSVEEHEAMLRQMNGLTA